MEIIKSKLQSVNIILFLVGLFFISFNGCVSNVPLQSAKTLPKGAHNVTVQVGVLKPKFKVETIDTLEPVQQMRSDTGWSMCYRYSVSDWLELGIGGMIFGSFGNYINGWFRIPLTESSAGILSPYLVQKSRFGLSWFASGVALVNGNYTKRDFILFSTGLTTSFDLMQVTDFPITLTVISGIEYGYGLVSWTKIWNWDEEDEFENEYGMRGNSIVIPVGLSLDIKMYSFGVGARFGFPLTKASSFQSEFYPDSYVQKFDFGKYFIVTTRFGYSFKIKK